MYINLKQCHLYEQNLKCTLQSVSGDDNNS